MLKILQEISKRTLLLNEYDFSERQIQSKWLGEKPATEENLKDVEKILQIKLPEDYVQFLKITNGFPQCINTGVTFSPIESIDFLINVDEDLVEIWNENPGTIDIGETLAESILIGGLNEEQSLLLIPPKTVKDKWKYWKFASWIPGEYEFKDLKSYLKSELSFLKEETKGLRKPKTKFINDYSLRDYIFNSEWEQAYNTTLRFVYEGKTYGYFDPNWDLFKLLLMLANKLNRFGEVEKVFENLRLKEQEDATKSNPILIKFEEAAKNKLTYIPNFQMTNFSSKEEPTTIDQIEQQIKTHRNDLLKPKNRNAKIDYQLYFLFTYGNAKNFVEIYEEDNEPLFFDSHFKAAIVFASIKDFEKAKKALEKYFEKTFTYRPLEPFLHSVLLPVLDENFTKEVLIRIKQRNSL